MAHADKFMAGDIQEFSQCMKKLINNKDSSDIRFVIGPDKKAIHAHRTILSARCQVFFHAFVEKPTKNDGPFVLPDISVDVFLAFLEYLYTNCVTVNNVIVVDLLGCSIEYGLDGLRRLCVQYLTDAIDEHTVCQALQASVTYKQEDLLRTALDYIDRHIKLLFTKPCFHELSAEAVAAIAQRDHLNCDEFDLLRAIREWATVNSVALHKSTAEVARTVVTHIRLPTLTMEQLTQTEEDNKKDKMIPVDALAFAWKCHALKTKDSNNPLTQPRTPTT